jgi:hypothetical protein
VSRQQVPTARNGCSPWTRFPFCIERLPVLHRWGTSPCPICLCAFSWPRRLPFRSSAVTVELLVERHPRRHCWPGVRTVQGYGLPLSPLPCCLTSLLI